MKKTDGIHTSVKRVLVFDSYGILSAMIRSVNAAGQLTGLFPQSISHACSGKIISSGGFYFRHLDDTIIIEPHDFGELHVKQYDEATKQVKQYKSANRLLKERKHEKG